MWALTRQIKRTPVLPSPERLDIIDATSLTPNEWLELQIASAVYPETNRFRLLDLDMAYRLHVARDRKDEEAVDDPQSESETEWCESDETENELEGGNSDMLDDIFDDQLIFPPVAPSEILAIFEKHQEEASKRKLKTTIGELFIDRPGGSETR